MINDKKNSDKIIKITATIAGFLTIIIGFIMILSLFYFGDKPTGKDADNSLDKLLKSDSVKSYNPGTLTPNNQSGGKKY